MSERTENNYQEPGSDLFDTSSDLDWEGFGCTGQKALEPCAYEIDRDGTIIEVSSHRVDTNDPLQLAKLLGD
ncbi:MAG: hypothetical protein NUV69_05625 [Candidatus Curtissbacteria bacterium]|nr:hypothetical protein [Candidatus Curtissbacteria bacterium]